jgi:hypothetical protein
MAARAGAPGYSAMECDYLDDFFDTFAVCETCWTLRRRPRVKGPVLNGAGGGADN